MSDKLIYRLIIALTVFSAMGLTFFGLAGLFSPGKLLPAGTVVSEGITTYAHHMGARNLSIVILMVAALVLQSRRMLGYMLLLNGLIQAFDGVFGAMSGEVMRTVFPVLICVTNLLAAKYLLSRASATTLASAREK